MLKTNAAAREYVAACANAGSINTNLALQYISESIKYYRAARSVKDTLKAPLRHLEDRWYQSLDQGEPDYSIYGDAYYVCDVWACWILYSRKYLSAVRTGKCVASGMNIAQMLGPHVQSAVDLGCGCGYSTARLKELFPSADVYGTNVEKTMQFQVAAKLGQRSGFTVVPSLDSINKQIDLIFASEYFEHVQAPVDHLADIVKTVRPKCFVIANSFRAHSMGHFNEYLVNAQAVPNHRVARLFNKALRLYGFEQLSTDCWNGRPSVWMLKTLCAH